VILGGETAGLDEDLAATAVDLARLLIVSRIDHAPGEITGADVPGYPGLVVAVEAYEAATCSRCWRRFDQLVEDPELPDLCERCHNVVSRLLSEGRAELREATS
jgi:hypothetical protein